MSTALWFTVVRVEENLVTETFETRRDASDDTPNAPATRRSRREAESSQNRRGARSRTARSTPAPTAPKARQKRTARSWASTAIVGIVVPGLFATMALPSYATPENSGENGQSSYALASQSAQTLDASGVEPAMNLVRDIYSATTPEELAEAKKAAEEAAAAKRARANAASNSGVTNRNYSAIAGEGEVRWPLPSGGNIGDGFMSRGGEHHGTDILIAGGTPIGAIADGVVVVSQESYGGYGVGIVIEHKIGGQTVRSTYGHMTYGSRQVSVGQHVTAGQVIGLVGSTGRSTANHLHIEITINGGLVDPIAWLHANGA